MSWSSFDSSAPPDTCGDYAVDHGHAGNEAYQPGGYTGWLDSAPGKYGWCEFCPGFTYHDLWHGACGDCRWRWGHCPETMPAQLQRYRAEMQFPCSRDACAGTRCPAHGG
jgi:hypothetical protein